MDDIFNDNVNRFLEVANRYNFPEHFATLNAKMVQKEDLDTEEEEDTEHADFAFFSLACQINAEHQHGSVWSRMKDSVGNATRLEGDEMSYDMRRYIRELIQNARRFDPRYTCQVEINVVKYWFFI